jgi:hypothetical protein
LRRQDFAADIIYHVIASGSANDPLGTKNSSKKMGRRSKVTLSRVNNLGHAQKNLRAQVENITDLQDPGPDNAGFQRKLTTTVTANMKASLDSDSKVCSYDPLTLNSLNFNLLRYVNRSARLCAVWANRKYHGHRILPPEILTKLENEFHKKYGVTKYCSLLL